MDEIISQYIQKEFSHEVQETLLETFILFDKFNLQYYQGELLEILSGYSNSDTTGLRDKFISKIYSKIDFIYSAHSIQISHDIPLYKKVEILNSLYLLMEQEDYSFIISTIESNLPDSDKVSRILSQFTTFSESECYTLIESVDPIFISKLKTFIHQRLIVLDKAKYGIDDSHTKIYEEFKRFRKYYRNKLGDSYISTGEYMISANIIVGRELTAYKAYFQEMLKDTDELHLAINIISLLLLTKEGFDNIILTFKNNSNIFFTELNIITKLDSLIQTTINDYNAFNIRAEGYQ